MISKLQHFTSEVAQYQREYPWLLLISIPKTILVSDLLKKNTSTFNIACEMIYLSKKDLKWEEMELQVEVGIQFGRREGGKDQVIEYRLGK